MCKILALDFYGPTHPSFLNSLISYNFCTKGDLGVLFHVSIITIMTIITHFFLWLFLHGNTYWFISTIAIVWPTSVTLAYQPEIQQFSIFTSGTLFTSEPPSTGFIDTFGHSHPVGALKVLNERYLFITAAISRPGLS